MKHLLLAASLLSLLLLGVPADGLDGFRYSRTVDVDAPGWTSVQLDGNALVNAPSDLTLLAPAGTEVPFHVTGERAKRRAVRVLGVDETGDGWAIRLDLGPRPPRHERLFFDFRQQANVPGCRLEASADGRRWTPLARADLFLLGDTGDLRLNVVDYPPSTARYLRLHWPRSAGLPELRKVEAAELSSAETLELEHHGEDTVTIDLPRPLDLLRRLDLDIEATGTTGYRLRHADGGRWQVLTEGVAYVTEDGEDLRLRLPLGLKSNADDAVVLELYGGARLRRASARRTARRLVFDAAEAGRYVLAYGSSVQRRHEPPADEPSGRVAHVTAGAEEESPWPPLPPTLTEPAAQLQGTFESAWRIVPGDARAGTAVRLEIDAAVRAAARQGLGDLRLDAGGRQLPYVLRRLPRPEELSRAKVQGEEDGTETVYTLTVPTANALELVLEAGQAPFERRVSGRYAVQERPGVDPRSTGAFSSASWSCRDLRPLPCALHLDLGRPASADLRLTVANGDNPPLGPLDATLFTPRDILVFVWPGQDVILRAGADLRAPRYDLAELAEILASRDLMELELGERLEAPSTVTLPSWALPAVIALAAAVLLLLLVRMLRSESPKS